MSACRERLQVRVTGAVQGVGFRPFVHRLAARYDLSGYVLNDAAGVLLEVEGERLDPFLSALEQERPPLARIDSCHSFPIPAKGGAGFEIRESAQGRTATRITPDSTTCGDCLDELFDPTSRFYRYPFVTCTHCGPRFTITRGLPYDRAQTSLAQFPLCPACARDYRDVTGRRFHAEAIACPACGPRLSHSIETVAEALSAGRIVALKGIGGFHLMCDAWNEPAVAELRRRKMRAAKPFAVMVANLPSVDFVASPNAFERELLASCARPIVLMPGRTTLAPSIAPGLNRVGVMLPYAPLHHLLFQALSGQEGRMYQREAPQVAALVATSANPGGEPLVTGDDDARHRLAGIADLIVTHDRAIVTRADDSVMAVIDGAPAYLRRARGVVPEPIDLGEDGPAILAVGGFLKTTVTVTRGREAFISQHIGDLDRAATVRFHEETVCHFLKLLGVTPEAVACDLHPDFPSTRFAEGMGLPVIPVQHHVAHLAAVTAEHRVSGPVLGVALDGHGRGPNGEAWGGELMRLEGAAWKHLGHLSPLGLPGGDRAARDPWRMGVAALAALGRAGEAASYFPDQPLAGRVAQALAAPGATGITTSMGRLFDAAAALLGLRSHQSYEGQAAAELESLATSPVALPGGFRIAEGVLDFRPLLAALTGLQGDRRIGSDLFHGTVIAGLTAWIAGAAVTAGLTTVALGGGCFMNRILAEGLAAGLRDHGLTPLLPRAVPANDGGLSFGQARFARFVIANRRSFVTPAERDRPCVSPSPSA